MPKTNWKREVPQNLAKALQLTKEHGIREKGMSVERIGDHLGTTGDLIYKWIGTNKMPINKIIPFEQVCGINFITQYLAHSQGYLLVKAPSGHRAEHKELNELQLFMTKVSGYLIQATEGSCDPQVAIDAIKVLMQDLAYQQKNVAEHTQPQTAFELSENCNENA
ncbi:hypothetical protein tloyanaT_25970 [Thalassotalea loyana]|uniref:XRE family transcriptional regulator n=1 Tax=Thalassotalea loyana TaxID=280483 RepID=A0ABQ6HFZ1_9GAMM|nr:hypothetical protein [Thalassotalea loyana]GLX86344.1 hypothetical protein tloyanaT_25970 [Thalassotalea loyana]